MTTIEQAVKRRIDRFNRLYLQAVGYSFEDEPAIEKKRFDKEIAEWDVKKDEFAHNCGFQLYDELLNRAEELRSIVEGRNPDEVLEELEELDKYAEFFKTRPVAPSALYTYEMVCIEQAVSIAKYFLAKGGAHFFNWLKYDYDPATKTQKHLNMYKFVEAIKATGYTDWEPGHSGNSAYNSIILADLLLNDIDWFPYWHGCLAPMVGDEGYHDDRSDVPKI